jgi:hypothetical protein
MSEQLKRPCSKYFPDEEVDALTAILKAAAEYGEGNALAGVKLIEMDEEEYKAMEESLEQEGLAPSTPLRNRMSLVDFVSNPDTGDEDVDSAIRNL